MDTKALDKEFKKYLDIFQKDAELVKLLNRVSFQDLFNPIFLTENSKFKSMDDMIWRSGFGIMNLMEVEQVNQENWNAYIAKNTECTTWHEFGKLAMLEWMKLAMKAQKEAAKKAAAEKKTSAEAEKTAK